MAKVSEDFANHPLKNVKFSDLVYLSKEAVYKCRCVKCNSVPFDRHAFSHAKCGHLVCKNCYPDGDQVGISHACDLCKQSGPVTAIPTQDIIKAASKLEVFCPNFGNGCHIIVAISNFLAHQKYCQKITKDAQQTGDLKKLKVEDAICKGDIEGAKEALRDFEKTKRNDPDINNLSDRIKVSEKEGKLTMSYLSKLRYPMALEHATKLLQDSYDCIKFICIKAECLINLGQSDEAQVLYQKLLLPQPTKTSDVMYIDALIKFNQANFPGAIKTCGDILKDEDHAKTKLLKVAVEKVSASLKNAQEKLRRQQYQEAQEALKDGFVNTKDTNKLVLAELLECRANASIKLSAFIDAVADCRRAIECDPNRLQTLLLSIDGNIGMEEFNRALEDGELAYTLKKEQKDVRQKFVNAVVNWENHLKQKYSGKYVTQVEEMKKEFPQTKPKEAKKKASPEDADNGAAEDKKKKDGPKLTKEEKMEQFEKTHARVMTATQVWDMAGLQKDASNPQILAALKGLTKMLHPDAYKGNKIAVGDIDKAFKKVRKASDELAKKATQK